MTKKSIADLADNEIAQKRVLVRTDFNLPMNPDGSVASDFRIRETLPTLEYLLERQARIIIATHMGRPKGQVDPKLSLKPVVECLRKNLPDTTIHFVDNSVGPEVDAAVAALKPGEILMLENIRFQPGETKNDPELAKALAQYAEVYVNDAFGAAHRAHASTEGVAHHVPVRVAGLLMARELRVLEALLAHPQRPFMAIIGGSKVSSKMGVLSNMMKLVDNLVIGGGMVFTFLKAKGYAVGNSLVEDDYVETAQKLMQEAEAQNKVIVLPKDIVVADRFAADAPHQVVPISQIPDGWMGLDIGPESIDRIKEVLQNTKTVFWNGPLGVFEFPAFATATQAVADQIADLTTSGKLTSILGGGDTQAAIDQFDISPSRYTHVSTGGGATMELLEGLPMPGVVVLDDKLPTVSRV